MAYAAFSLLPASVADHLTVGNLGRHAATEIAPELIRIKERIVKAALHDDRSFLRIGLATTAIATFTSNNPLRFICTAGLAILTCLHTRNATQKVKACAVQLHESTVHTNQRYNEISQKISGLRQEQGSFHPWLAKAKNLHAPDAVVRIVETSLEQVNHFLERADKNLAKIQTGQAEARTLLDRGNSHIKQTSRSLYTYAPPLILASMASGFFPNNGILPLIFRAGVHCGLMLTCFHHIFSLFRATSRLSPLHEKEVMPMVNKDLNQAKSYLELASQDKAQVDQRVAEATAREAEINVREATEDLLKRLNMRLAPHQQLLSKTTKLDTHIENYVKLCLEHRRLEEEGLKFMNDPLKSRADADAFKSKCDNLLDSLKQFFQKDGENEKFHIWCRAFLKASNRDGQIRLRCFEQIEKRFSHHPHFPIVQSLLRMQKRFIKWNASQALRNYRYRDAFEKDLLGLIDKVCTIMERLVDIKLSSSNRVTGEITHKKF